MAVKFEKQGDGTYLLDVTGMVCPHPQIYTKKSLEKIRSGEILHVRFDNPSSAETISALCSKDGYEVLEKQEESGLFLFKIKKP